MEATRPLDLSTFDARYAELFADLRRVCRAMGAGADAEDVAQEVLVNGRSRLHELRDDAKLVPWLRRIAVRSTGRGHRPQGDRGATDAPVDPGLGLVDLSLDERAALRTLGTRQRQLVALVYFAGYHQDEAADMLGISRGTGSWSEGHHGDQPVSFRSMAAPPPR